MTEVDTQTDTVWKIALATTDYQQIQVPKGAKFLCVREQGETPCIWFRCNPNSPQEARKIIIAGTGHGVPPNTQYIGTFFQYGGELVFHVFELIPHD